VGRRYLDGSMMQYFAFNSADSFPDSHIALTLLRSYPVKLVVQGFSPLFRALHARPRAVPIGV
jgi:hypothetical protein